MKRYLVKRPIVVSLVMILLNFSAPGYALAEVVTDGTLGAQESVAGPDYQITASLGRQVGMNLFQSFSAFNIYTNESATFKGPESIENVICRVTGGHSSTIDGLLRSEIAGADFYFLNPSGIMFGQNARLDVSGSFHAATADYLKLGETGRFDAATPDKSLLVSAPPSAFGFLGDTPSPVGIEMSFLEVPEGKTISIVGGDITLYDAILYARGGRVNLASGASSGEVSFTANSIEMNGFSQEGTISVFRDSNPAYFNEDTVYYDIEVSGMEEGHTGGSIYIRGGRFEMVGSAIGADNYGNEESGGIVVEASSLIMESGGTISAAAAGAGDAGEIRLDLDSLTINGGSWINSNTYGSGAGGGITITATDSVTVDGFPSGLYANTFSSGKGGRIDIETSNLIIENRGSISTGTGGAGDAGKIRLDVDVLSVTGGGWIENSTTSYSSGAGGGIIINAKDSVTIDGYGSRVFADVYGSGTGGSIDVAASSLIIENEGTISAWTGGEGDAGEIRLDVDFLNINDWGQIDSSTFGSGKGGRIDVVTSSLIIENAGTILAETWGTGDAGEIQLDADSLSVNDGGQIDSSTYGSGAAGGVTINAAVSVMIGGENQYGQYSGVLANTNGAGRGGSIDIETPNLILDDGGQIQAGTIGAGDAGEIQLTVDSLSATGGGQINSSTSFGSGAAGGIIVNAENSVTIAGEDQYGNSSCLIAITAGSGTGGIIHINAPSLNIKDGGFIAAGTMGAGDAGEIQLTVDSLSVTTGGQINSSTYGSGAAGGIALNADDSVTISGEDQYGRYSILSVTTRAGGQGGSIDIETPSLIIDEGGQIRAETEGMGNAGQIRLHVDSLLINGGARLDSSTYGSGGGGGITIKAGNSVTVSGKDQYGYRSGLFVNTYTGGGQGGSIDIETPSLIIEDAGTIQAGTGGTGDAGKTRLDVDALSVTGGAQINSSTYGSGAAGGVTVNARDSVIISGEDQNGNPSGIFATTFTGGGQSGSINIETPNLIIKDAGTIQAATHGMGDAGKIQIDVDSLSVTSGGWINSSTYGSGMAGGITVSARDSVTISGEDQGGYYSSLSADTHSDGKGGSIDVETHRLILDDEGGIQAKTSGPGAAGEIRIDVDVLSVNGGSQISSATTGDGAAGGLTINARDSVLISGEDQYGYRSGLFANTYTGSGTGGSIDIETASLIIDGGGIQAGTEGTGDAGEIRIDVNFVSINGGGQISSDTYGSGAAGGLTIYARDSVTIAGKNQKGEPSGLFVNSFTGGGIGGSIAVETASLNLNDDAQINAYTQGAGDAGEIQLVVNSLRAMGGTQISSDTYGSGAAGGITIRAEDSVTISGKDQDGNPSGLFANTFTGGGIGGSIRVETSRLNINNEGVISAKTEGDGSAGDIQLLADSIVMNSQAEISAQTSGSGAGGKININGVNSVSLENGSSISCQSSDTGNAGSLIINAGNTIVLKANSQLMTRADNAEGGDIQLNCDDLLYLLNSDITTSVAGGTGNGGNIRIDPTLVVLNNGKIIANAYGGNGGNIHIASTFFLSSWPGSRVQASSRLGINGRIQIDAPKIDIGSSLAILSGSYLDIGPLLYDMCSVRSAEDTSSLVVKGRGGLPLAPDDGFPSLLLH